MMVNRLWLMVVVALALPLSATACGFGEKTADGYENTAVKHAFQHWNHGVESPIPFVFIDVRTPDEYADGHIKGAILIPVQELERRMVEVPKDKQVYLYCHSGVRSARAASILAKAGFSNIENVVGGIVAWKEAGYPIEIGEMR